MAMPTTASTPMRIELVDLLLRGDAARGDDAAGGRLAYGADRVHRDALHQALGVDVGVEELVAERLERPCGLDRSDLVASCQPRIVTTPWELSTAAITCARPTRVGQSCGELEIELPALEEGRAHDDVRGAQRQHVLRALDGADAATDAARLLGADLPKQWLVRAAAPWRRRDR